MTEPEKAVLTWQQSTNLQESRVTTATGVGSETGSHCTSVVAATLALAALAGVAYLVIAQYRGRDERLTRGNAAPWRQANDEANITTNAATEDKSEQGTETDTPDSDWIPAEEEAKKLLAGPAVALLPRKGRRAASRNSRIETPF
ncbi:uncharacterized protein LOC144120180 [Amblyomma americanum]